MIGQLHCAKTLWQVRQWFPGSARITGLILLVCDELPGTIKGVGAARRRLPGRLSEKYVTLDERSAMGVVSPSGGGGADTHRFTGLVITLIDDAGLLTLPRQDCLRKAPVPCAVCAIDATDGRAVWEPLDSGPVRTVGGGLLCVAPGNPRKLFIARGAGGPVHDPARGRQSCTDRWLPS